MDGTRNVPHAFCRYETYEEYEDEQAYDIAPPPKAKPKGRKSVAPQAWWNPLLRNGMSDEALPVFLMCGTSQPVPTKSRQMFAVVCCLTVLLFFFIPLIVDIPHGNVAKLLLTPLVNNTF